MRCRSTDSSRARPLLRWAIGLLLAGLPGGCTQGSEAAAPGLHATGEAAPCRSISNGRTFYLRAEGDDASSGRSPSEGWQTLARLNDEPLEPGDTVLLEGGAHFAGTLELAADDSGSACAPVRVSSFGAERAVIEAGAGDALSLVDAEGLVIERLRLLGDWDAAAQRGNDGEGVRATSGDNGRRLEHIRLAELEISGFKHAGIGLHARPSRDDKSSGFHDVEIRDSVVHDNGDFGIISDGPYLYDAPGYSHADLRVRHVRVHHNRGLRDKAAHTGSGIVLSDVEGALIEHSIAHDNGEYNDHEGGGGFGIWAWDSDRVVIQYNEAYDNRTMTSDGGGFDLDGGVTRSVMQYNYSHGNQGAGYGAFQFAWARPFFDNVIRYNISQGDGSSFLVWDGNGDMGSLAVLSNVGYGTRPALVTYSSFQSVHFINNVFYGLGPLLFDVFSGTGLTLQGNAYWTDQVPLRIGWNTGTAASVTHDSFERYREQTGQESLAGAATGHYVDPQLVAAGSGGTLADTARLTTLTMYRLRDSSPLIDRGLDPARFGIAPVERDFFGTAPPQGSGFDIGAHEHP